MDVFADGYTHRRIGICSFLNPSSCFSSFCPATCSAASRNRTVDKSLQDKDHCHNINSPIPIGICSNSDEEYNDRCILFPWPCCCTRLSDNGCRASPFPCKTIFSKQSRLHLAT